MKDGRRIYATVEPGLVFPSQFGLKNEEIKKKFEQKANQIRKEMWNYLDPKLRDRITSYKQAEQELEAVTQECGTKECGDLPMTALISYTYAKDSIQTFRSINPNDPNASIYDQNQNNTWQNTGKVWDASTWFAVLGKMIKNNPSLEDAGMLLMEKVLSPSTIISDDKAELLDGYLPKKASAFAQKVTGHNIQYTDQQPGNPTGTIVLKATEKMTKDQIQAQIHEVIANFAYMSCVDLPKSYGTPSNKYIHMLENPQTDHYDVNQYAIQRKRIPQETWTAIDQYQANYKPGAKQFVALLQVVQVFSPTKDYDPGELQTIYTHHLQDVVIDLPQIHMIQNHFSCTVH